MGLVIPLVTYRMVGDETGRKKGQAKEGTDRDK